MPDIAFIGERPSILGFKAIGAEIFSARDRDEAVRILDDIFRKDYKVVYITEELAEKIQDYLNKIEKLWPIITIIPGFRGSKGLGKARLKNYIIKATGTDILGS